MRFTVCLLLLLGCAACAAPTTEDTLRELYRESRSTEVEDRDPEQDERLLQVLALLDSGAVTTAAERLYAAGCLMESAAATDVARAAELALAAAEDGDERGLPLAAEAIDRERMLNGERQRYGTQYMYTAGTGRWSLYPWDTGTTDAERRAMGVPSLAELLNRLDQLNQP